MNLVEETKLYMEKIEKKFEDIDFVNLPKLVFNEDGSINKSAMWDADYIDGTIHDFLEYAKYFEEYDNGYGGAEVHLIYIIFKDKSWLQRGEYDGSEWWDYMKCPERI